MPFSFNPDKELPEINGKVVFITGGSSRNTFNVIRRLTYSFANQGPLELVHRRSSNLPSITLPRSISPAATKSVAKVSQPT